MDTRRIEPDKVYWVLVAAKRFRVRTFSRIDESPPRWQCRHFGSTLGLIILEDSFCEEASRDQLQDVAEG